MGNKNRRMEQRDGTWEVESQHEEERACREGNIILWYLDGVKSEQAHLPIRKTLIKRIPCCHSLPRSDVASPHLKHFCSVDLYSVDLRTGCFCSMNLRSGKVVQ